MKIMNMPGFTAENSFYHTSRRYQMTSSIHRIEFNASLVQPSAAIYSGGRFVCYGEVTEEGFINCYPPDGGLSEPAELVCGPCISGRQRCGIPGVGFSWGPCID
ncbi:hypothetical protein [Nitrosomonas sp. Nm166]|uniref:hypothetical protein n=1 Tax=Nitrosomonas sp. Nm166 TaxID=1881054 RepID=UPI0008EC65F7|nr:hypothetical protein [Nitrosomonas sp. Nm166]SFE23224.1 hypothetical protein SAMN05428977_101032 [Nitrosomonas sp. Nm166]